MVLAREDETVGENPYMCYICGACILIKLLIKYTDIWHRNMI